jgi:pseudaminic acid biosynthesis-associated methylase
MLLDHNYNQREFWKKDFGSEYIKRNISVSDIDDLYKKTMDITLEELYESFFGTLDRSISILELGCNIGLNLSILQKMNFKNLHGLDINQLAINKAKKDFPEMDFFNSSIEQFDIGKKFDLVFTSGVLIHINPESLNTIMQKMMELTNQYIFGFEYFSENLTEINYRNNLGVCWKQNFPSLFKNSFPILNLIQEKKFFHKDSDLCDVGYLLKK